ncbi:MAG: formate hydrogenlyase subunit 3/multisubunit Na+/H+ antiporter MnhD subunit [Planctomycetota bacterium]|jgi:formate hydrogenlyase subunit 3/multisubunit Na+/H+ antiporter MnhD subunit
MIHILPAGAGLLLAGVALHVVRIRDGQAARKIATIGSAAVLLVLATTAAIAAATGAPELDLFGFRAHWDCGEGRDVAPFVDLLVVLLAVGMAPLASHPPRTLSAVLQVGALALLFLAFSEPWVLAVLWALSAAVVARELSASGGSSCVMSRAFRRYQAPSLLLMFVAAALASVAPVAAAVCWLVAICIREAIVPMHGWLPALMAKAPLGLVVVFVGPQLGVHAHVCGVRTLLGVEQVEHLFAVVGAGTALLAAALGLVQKDARRAAAWLIISQTGLVAFGVENASAVGWAGAVLTWQVGAIGTSGFVMTIAALEARRGALSLTKPGGSFARTPRMAVAFLFLGFASVGLPMTIGFVAEDLLVQGSIDEYPQIGLMLIVVTALNGMNIMRCFFALFSGQRDHVGERDLTRLEVVVLTAAMAALLVTGVAPRLVLGPATNTPADTGHTHSRPLSVDGANPDRK